MEDIQSATAEIRRGKKIDRKKKKPQNNNTMVCPIPKGDHNKHQNNRFTVSKQPVVTFFQQEMPVLQHN